MKKGNIMTLENPKGRPMLVWSGKSPLKQVTPFPSQLIETYNKNEKQEWSDWSEEYPEGGLLFHGDNKEVLAHLLANGFRRKINLIYIDPPFNTGVNYIRKVTLRGIKMEKMMAEGYSFTEQIQYASNWHVDKYLQALYERLQLAKELLTQDGIIVIRLDVHFGFYIRLIGDEIFGQDAFQNEIVVNRIKKNVTIKGRRTIPHAVDYLYVYFTSNESEYKNVQKKLKKPKKGYWHGMDSPGVPGPRELTLEGKTYYPAPGTHLKFPLKQAEEMWEKGHLRENPNSGNLEYWVQERDKVNLDSNWTDIPGYTFKTGYPTENSEQLLERVILAGSDPGDIVLDFYIGSGTTAAVAQKLGRRWIGCDINKGSIHTTTKRLIEIIDEQTESLTQIKLTKKESITPTQNSFSIYRVNDYDLQIQHNEAIELACKHIGIQRTSNDPFFDGLHGRNLVKIIPFNHPLGQLDLEEVKRELSARPNEERDITIVCLGIEISTKVWLEEWNKLRKRGEVPNHIDVIELRTDPRYGKFFIHKPASAKVKIERVNDKIIINVIDFISPTIIERLQNQSRLLMPEIDDWRVMVDTIMIDINYNGNHLNVDFCDIPEKKDDLVIGQYELDAPKEETNVALKIVDMLGEEVIINKTI